MKPHSSSKVLKLLSSDILLTIWELQKLGTFFYSLPNFWNKHLMLTLHFFNTTSGKTGSLELLNKIIKINLKKKSLSLLGIKPNIQITQRLIFQSHTENAKKTTTAGLRVLYFYSQAYYKLMLQVQSETGHHQSGTENICKYTKKRRWYQIQTKQDTFAQERQEHSVRRRHEETLSPGISFRFEWILLQSNVTV